MDTYKCNKVEDLVLGCQSYLAALIFNLHMEAEAENETSPCIPLLSSVYFCLEWGVDMQSGRKVEHVMK